MLSVLSAQKSSTQHHEPQSQGERAGTCPFNAASTLQPDLPSHPRGAATEDEQDHSAGCTGLFLQYHKRHTRAVLSMGSPMDQTSCRLYPRVAPEVIAEGRRGSKTHLGLCSLSLVKTLEVDNLDLANTAFKSPPHCQLLTQASDDKNATLDEMGGEKKKTFQMK